MKFVILPLLCCTSAFAQGPLKVSESDGTPSFNGITELVFPPGSVTINGRQARIGVGGSSGVPGSGITSLNGMLGTTQTFSRTNDTNVTLTIASASNNHSFTIGWSGTLAKARQHAATAYTDQANTFGAFLQTIQAGNNFNLVDPGDTSRKAKFDLSNIATATTRSVNIPNADSTTVQADTGATHNFLTAISAQGVISKARPTCANLSDSAASCATDATNASNISSGTLPDGRFPATLPAASGVNLTALNASNLGSGTVPDARFPATLPAASGANLTNLNASNVSSGTLGDARLSANVPLLNAANAFSNSGDNTFAGNVGIGTTSPFRPLELQVTNAIFRIRRAANTNYGVVELTTGATQDWLIGSLNTSDSDLHFYSASVGDTVTILRGTGSVGIGTAAPARELTINGGVQLNTATSKPTCNSTNRGTFWVTQGGAGVKDNVEVCAKDAGDAYAWRTLY